MKARIFFPLTLAAYLALFFIHATLVGKTVYGDGIYYYSWVRSLVVDGNVNFENEFRHFGVGSFTTSLGLPANKFGIGSAVLWLPFFTQTHILLHGDGYSLPYQMAVGAAGTLYTVCGFVFIYLALLTKYSPKASLFATAALAYTTHILYYGAVDTVNSHAAGFFLSSIIFYLVLTKKTPLLTGILLGLLASIRFQDILFLIPAFFIVQSPTILLGFFIGFLPQLIAWQSVYGSPVINTYAFEGERFRWFTPHILQVLFAPGYGFLTTSPILIFSLFYIFKNKQKFNLVIVFLFLSMLYIVSSWGTYWQGASFGGRMFVSLLPLLSPGLAVFFTKTQLLSTVLLPLFTFLNMISIFRFLQGY